MLLDWSRHAAGMAEHNSGAHSSAAVDAALTGRGAILDSAVSTAAPSEGIFKKFD
jgi:hypothetical protein